MKIKKIKLLKALAMTGAFGIVATVPVIVSSCSSTSDNNGNGNTNGNTETQKVTPVLKDSVDLKGSLSKIFDTTATDAASRKSTNTLISEDIKANPEDYFTNGSDSNVQSAIQSATIDVEGNFSNASWTGNAYDTNTNTWSGVTIEDANKLVYTSNSAQLTFKDLDGLKAELEKTTGTDSKTVAQVALEAAGATFASGTTITIENRLGFTNDDLIHVNVKAAPSSGNPVNYDLQIPTSDLNLSVTGLSIKVTGENITEGEKTTTNFTYNIGIKEGVIVPTDKPNLATADKGTQMKVMEALGYTNTAGDALDDNKISVKLGLYNCKFTLVSATEDTNNAGTFTIKISATPNEGYV
ncbi:P35 lipoprotein homolog [Malacoplasma penetrans HF-2]|uniref:P35 lipoprotein homolog n=1 Tax=Malacoplasma penetrans (strain HF-2) TaxID=272633 RepID=Q8EV92_MALP2|nr:P35 family lipoprotein [Malacoplasma penetrans]BAC44466.1 P35 lipoprotein homolog [Malacoplasma penetrans HF-2]